MRSSDGPRGGGARALLVPGITALILIVAGWWLATPREDTSGDKGPDTGRAEDRPDYTLTDATIRRYDANGELASRLRSPRIEYRKASEAWSLSTPVWTHLGKTEWTGRAHRGHLLAGVDRGRLEGDVRLTRTAGGPRVTLRTPYLRIHPDSGYVETDAPVAITTISSKVTGIGARAWLDRQTMTIDNDVEGIHALR